MKPKLSKQPKYDIKVQKQTVAKRVEFKPVVQHRIKGSRQSGQGYIDSFKKILQSRLFSKQKPTTSKESSPSISQQVIIRVNEQSLTNSNNNNAIDTEGIQNNKNNQQQQIPQSQSITLETELSTQSNNLQNINKTHEQQQQQQSIINNEKQKIIQTSQHQQQLQQANYLKLLNTQHLQIKYIQKLTTDSVLIGNQNQIDMLQFKIHKQHKTSIETKQWSLHLNKPILGLTVSKLAESKILLWTQRQLHIYQFNIKQLDQHPKLIQKLTVQQQTIKSVQFVKKNIFLICCHSHIQIYQFTQANKYLTINKLSVMRWKCPQWFQVVDVPEYFGSNVKVFYANMREYDDGNMTGQDNNLDKHKSRQKNIKQQKSKQRPRKLSSHNPLSSTNSQSITAQPKASLTKKKDVFGLYYVEIQYDYSKTRINELKKVYEIKKNLRKQIKLFNISHNIFFMNLKTQVLAVKNGLIIDSVGVNFKFDNCYLKIIHNDLLVHILTDKIQFYKLELNYNVMPQKITVTAFDSVYFQRDLKDQFLSIVQIDKGYGVFFQQQLKKSPLQQLKAAQINYWYALTYPIPLLQKLNQIFPSTQQIQQTSFETIQTLCDMSCKMGLTLNESYRFLWRKSKKQTEKDYQILLLSRDYKTIQQQITLLLKKRAQKWRMINKNQEICLQFLRPRVFDFGCKQENLQQFSSCHFFNLKLRAYKDIEVERRRFELQLYKKGKQTSMDTMGKLMGMFEVREQREDNKQQEQQLERQKKPLQQGIGKKKLSLRRFSYESQQSQIMLQHDLDCSQQYFEQSQQQIDRHGHLNSNFQTINILTPFITINNQSNKTDTTHLEQPHTTTTTNLFDTFLKTSKNFQQIEEDRKTVQNRQKQKLRHQLQQKMKQPDYNEIKINIKDYYFFRDTSIKQYFMQIVAQLMSKQHTENDHMKYFALRVLIRNFKLLFRSIYEELLLEMISIYKHKVSRLIQHFIELLPFQYDHNTSSNNYTNANSNNKLPQHTTDTSLCVSIWQPVQSHQIQQMLFLSDITTIQNKQTVLRFKQNNLWYKRYYLAHHGVVTESKTQVREKYSLQNIKHIQQHYFYLFIAKFLEIKISLNKEIQSIQKKNTINSNSSPKNNAQQKKSFLHTFIQSATNSNNKLDKQTEQILNRINKQMSRTNQLLKRVQQIYPLMPQHLKGYLNLYFDLYNYLETFVIEQKHYSSIYDFLRLRDFQLFRIFFLIQKKSKGFLLKHILQKYQDPLLIQNGRQKFIQGIEHYFDSDKSQITDLKTILNRLNGQSREFHIRFEPLYECLLSAMMKKIRISPEIELKLDELLIYIQNIPFSTSNGRIFQKLLLIQQVHLQMQLVKRSRINMSIMQIRDCGQVVIGALVQAELRSNKLVLDNDVKEFTSKDNPLMSNSNRNINNNTNTNNNTNNKQHFMSTSLKTITQPNNALSTLSPTDPNNSDKPIHQPLIQESKSLMSGIMYSLSKLSLTKIQSIQQLKMYFWKCLSQLQCIKRHLYANQHANLLGFVFITQLLHEQQYLIPMIGQALQDDDIKQMLQLESDDGEIQKQFKKSIVYYTYKQRLSTHNTSYLESQTYIKQLLLYLPYTDSQRMLIQQQIRYCHLFKQCDYNIPYPLTVIRQIPILDEIEYHISQIKSQKIDKLNVEKLFNSMQTMRELVEPSICLTTKSLSQRVREFQRVLYEFVFFKYLHQNKLILALQMIDKLLILNPQQNVMIYCVFIIDAMLIQFNDTTGELLISLVSYYYDSANELRELLEELIGARVFTTVEFQQYVRGKIQRVIQRGRYRYFDWGNSMLNEEVRRMGKQLWEQQNRDDKKYSQSLQQQYYHYQRQLISEKQTNLSTLFTLTYHHIQQSSEHIKHNKYYQLIYRLMLFNPYQAAYFIYNKPQINLKAVRGFLSFISQQILLFDTEITLKVGEIVFIIMLNRIRDGFMISQQIKQYQKLNLNKQTFDQHEFMSKFTDNNKSTLTVTEKQLYDSYIAMKKKLQALDESNIRLKIQKQLRRVKMIYDNDTFLVNKHNIIVMRKYGQLSYLPYQKWIHLSSQSKLQYYLNNIEQYSSYKQYTYQYTLIDRDQSYVIKGEQQFNRPKISSWPTTVQFNKIINRHQILINNKNTRIPAIYKKQNHLNCTLNNKRDRKPSEYLPEEFKLNKKSTTDLHRYSVQSFGCSNGNGGNSNIHGIKHAQSMPIPKSIQNIITVVTSPKSNAGKIGKNQKPPTPKNIDNNNNPIMNFFNMGASFGNMEQFINNNQ